MTPAELNDYASGVKEAKQMGDYRLASLIRAAVWSKDGMPEYNKCFSAAKKEMTDDAIYSVVKALNAAMGGTEK